MSKISDFFLKNDPSRTLNAKRAYDDVVWKVGQLGPNVHIDQGKGYIFEFLENAKYNEMRGSQGLKYQNILTGMPKERGGYGEMFAPDDVRINEKSYQLKVHANVDDYFSNFYDPKYKGYGFVVPSDQYREIQEELFARYQQGFISKKQYLNLSNRIYKGQTSSQELFRYCDKNGFLKSEIAQQEANRSINRAFFEDCKTMVGTTTLSYTITGSVISSIKNVKKYHDGEIKKEECLNNIFKDTAKSAGKGFAIGTLANVFNFIGHSVSSGSILQSGAVSLTLANGVFDLGATYREYINGNIDSANFYEQIITKSVVSAAVLISRVALITNPIMSAIFACVVSSITNELLKGSKEYTYEGDASLFNEELARQIEVQNNDALSKLEHLTKKQEKNYFEVKSFIEAITKSNDSNFVINGLVQISEKLNLNIQFDTFEEFEYVMKNKNRFEI